MNERSGERMRGLRLVVVACVAWSVAWALALASCGGGTEQGASEAEGSVASVTPIRGEARIDEAVIASLGRAAPGAVVEVPAASNEEGVGLARLVLDLGASALLDRGARVVVLDADALRVEAGRALLVAPDDATLELEVLDGLLRVANATVSISVADGAAELYVVRGEVGYRRGESTRGVARAGELLRLRPDGGALVEASTLFSDWTGGLFSSGPGESSAPGLGVLEAREPGEQGRARWPLSIRRLDVRVSIVGELAVTEVEQEFFNPASETVEGLYRMRVPEGAVLQRFAVDRDGRMVEGFVREKAQARADYQAQVYRGSTDDPALLEWDSPSSYRARIYPIAAGSVRRIAVRYVEWLHPAGEGAPRIYRFPMGEGSRAPHVQELSFVADVARAEASSVRAGMGASVLPSAENPGRVELRRSDFRPRADLVLELTPRGDSPREGTQRAYRAAHTPPRRAPGSRVIAGEADERPYFYLPLRLPDALFASEGAPRGLDLVIVADVSAGTTRAELELGRSVVEAIAQHLGPNDRVSVVTADLAVRAIGEGERAMALGPATPERVDALLDGLARVSPGGATDLGAVFAQAAALLDPSRDGAMIYVGDGTPTVGELGAEGLAARLLALPHPTRFYAVGVGADANLGLLSQLTQGGGLALRVEEQEGAAEASLAMLAHLRRPVLHRVTVELGAGLDNAFPRTAVDVVQGEVIDVVARVRDRAPDAVTVRGLRNGAPFEERIAIATSETEAAQDLRLRWANQRLAQLLASGASREEIAELGTRTGLITPYTSYYVPSASDLASGRYGSLDAAPLLSPTGSEAPGALDWAVEAALGVALGPLLWTGCTFQSSPFASDEAQELQPSPTSSPAGSPASGVSMPELVEESAEGSAPAPDLAPMAPALAQAAPASPVTAAPSTDPSGRYDQLLAGGAAMEAEAAIAVPPEAEPTVAREEAASSAGAVGYLGGGLGDGLGDPSDGDWGGLGLRGTGHGGGGGVGTGYGVGSGARPQAAPPRSAARQRPIAPSVGDSTGRSTTVRTTVTTTVTTTTTPSALHTRQRCSDAASVPLADRRALWAERLSSQGFSVSRWLELYAEAGRACELPSSRDRRAFLETMLGRAGSLGQMIQLYSASSDATARGFFRSAILRRVRTADDLRQVRAAFGLSASVDWSLVEQILERATTPAARLDALRRLVEETPSSLELRLRLLEELEAQGKLPEARRLAERLRTDPLADPGVRTAIGELYLRLGLEDDARRTFSEIVEFQPMDELARRRLGDLYSAHGWYEDAYRQYETLVSIRPDDPMGLLLLARAAAGAGRVDEALRLEQRVMETSERGASAGVARAALLWSSVRFATLRKEAEARGAAEDLEALAARMRRSGVLRGTARNDAPSVRASLVWSHPDASLALYAAYPGLSLSRPSDLYSEVGIEAFDVEEQEAAPYRIEVRRNVRDRLGTLDAQLVVVWNEGREDERIEILPLTFDADHRAYAYTLQGRTLSPAALSADAQRTNEDAPSVRMTAGGAR